MTEKIKIPKSKPSRLLLAAVSLSLAVHLAFFAAVQFTPTEEKSFVGKYDYLSSAVWEIFGPTNVVRLMEVHWPGTSAESAAMSPECADPESALDGLGQLDLWCSPSGVWQ